MSDEPHLSRAEVISKSRDLVEKAGNRAGALKGWVTRTRRKGGVIGSMGVPFEVPYYSSLDEHAAQVKAERIAFKARQAALERKRYLANLNNPVETHEELLRRYPKSSPAKLRRFGPDGFISDELRQY